MAQLAVSRTASWALNQSVSTTRTASWALRVAVASSRTASWDLGPPWAATPNCSVDPANGTQAFQRVFIDYVVLGGGRISWTYQPHFNDPLPYTLQLQSSPGGVVTADDWVNIGPPATNVSFLIDTQQRMYGKTETQSYRVVLTTPNGVYYSPVAGVLGKLDFHGWLIVREIVRKELLRHRIFGSVPAYFLKARRYGPICPCTDAATGLIRDDSCPNCYSTGFVGGYYSPVACSYTDAEPEQSRENRGELGTELQVVQKSRMMGFPHLVQGDAVVSRDNDERFYIHSVTEAACYRSVPIIYEAELRRAPLTDALYLVPLPQV